MKIAWTKIVSIIFGGLILALQGINIHETAEVTGTVETSEGNLINRIYQLEKQLADVSKAQVARTKLLMKKFEVEEPSPSPSPEH